MSNSTKISNQSAKNNKTAAKNNKTAMSQTAAQRSTDNAFVEAAKDIKEASLARSVVEVTASVADDIAEAAVLLGGKQRRTSNNTKTAGPTRLAAYFGGLNASTAAIIGGLEYDESRTSELKINGLTHVVGERFKSELRKAMLDWAAFTDQTDEHITTSQLFEQIAVQLNIKSDAKDYMLEVVERIYRMSSAEHLICMMRQYRVLEPFSTAVFGLFSIIAQHIEHMIRMFFEARAAFLSGKKYTVDDDGTVEFPANMVIDFENIAQRATEINEQYALSSSSAVLLLINPPETIPVLIDFIVPVEFPALHKQSLALQAAIDAFHYEGYCPKRPVSRLRALLNFPLAELAAMISALQPSVDLPDYEKAAVVLAGRHPPQRPQCLITHVVQTPPANLHGPKLVIWYVDRIMEVRRALLADGERLEAYYIEAAKDIIDLTAEIKNVLEN